MGDRVKDRLSTLAEKVDGTLDGLATKKRKTWSKRLYLAMVDVRTLAKTVPRDVRKLRRLTDAAGIPVGVAMVSGVKRRTVEVSGVRCVWMWPFKAGDEPAACAAQLLYIHGGAFCLGSPETHSQTACQLSKMSGAAVLMPDYRLCPENTIGDAHQDVMAVYQWLVGQVSAVLSPADASSAQALAQAARRIVVGGESAGASLSLGLSLRLRMGECPQLAGLALISPWSDLVDSVERKRPSWAENEGADFVLPELAELFARHVLAAQKFGGIVESHTAAWQERIDAIGIAELVELASSEDVSPGLAKSFAGIPRTLVTTGGAETLRDSQFDLTDRLKEDGVQVESELYEDMPHAVILANFLGSASCTAPRDVVDRVSLFIRDCCNAGP